MGKNRKAPRISKRQQARAKNRGLKELWVDGCYFDQEQKAGGAAVICDASGNIESTISFELNHVEITESNHAELWAAASVLNAMPGDSVGQLSSDCPAVVTSIVKIRAGKAPKIFDPELLSFLKNGVQQQPNMQLKQVTRGQGKIPVADRFAKAAARADLEGLEKASRNSGNHPHTHTPSPIEG